MIRSNRPDSTRADIFLPARGSLKRPPSDVRIGPKASGFQIRVAKKTRAPKALGLFVLRIAVPETGGDACAPERHR